MGEPKFESSYIEVDYESKLNGNTYTYNIEIIPYANECVGCKQVVKLSSCSNCRGTKYEVGKSSDRQLGIFCQSCDKGFSRWTCSHCGTDNAVAKTFGKYSSSLCFIATATFESEDAPEVLALRSFRDTVLLPHFLGRAFTNLYYKLSPFIAVIIAQSPALKRISQFILKHIVAHLPD